MAHGLFDNFSILIIDDNRVLLNDYKTFLEQAGITVFAAEAAPQGIALAEKEKPSLILLDLMLPQMNGLEALKALKESDKTRDIPVMVITALVNDAERAQSLEAGAIDYIEKVEVEPDELLRKIRHFAQKHAEKEANA